MSSNFFEPSVNTDGGSVLPLSLSLLYLHSDSTKQLFPHTCPSFHELLRGFFCVCALRLLSLGDSPRSRARRAPHGGGET